MKPDWKDAPKWAQWLAMDGDGWWNWFEDQPLWEPAPWSEWVHSEDGHVRHLIAGDSPDESGIDWDFAYSTLEPRP